MRVAIFTNTYHPTLNGVANCVDAYCRGLEARGHEVFIFAPCPNDYDPSEDSERVLRFPAVPFPGDWDYDIAVPYSKPVMSALRDVDYDLVHTQHPVWVGTWGAWFARWAGLPIVTTIHTEYELYARLVPLPEQLVEAYLKVQVTGYCNKCHMVTTPAQSARDRLLAQGVVVPVEILYNPIDLSELPETDPAKARAAHDIDPRAFVMGFIGRLAPEKDLQLVLDTAAIVMDKVRPAHFLVVGDGSEMKTLQAHARDIGIADKVTFTGFIDHSEIPHYQAALDAFVTASMSETQPLAYTEAMAVGTPVVALRAPGAQDMIEPNQNGLLSDPEDGAEGLAAEILKLAADPQLSATIAQTAKQRVRRYELGAVTDKLLEIYDTAAQRHRDEQEQQ